MSHLNFIINLEICEKAGKLVKAEHKFFRLCDKLQSNEQQRLGET